MAKFWVAAIVLIVAFFAYLLWPQQTGPITQELVLPVVPEQEQVPVEITVPPAPLAEVTAPTAPEVVLVPPAAVLAESDAQAQLAVADVAPGLAQWLVPEQLIRKLVLAVDSIAEGKIPGKHRPWQISLAKFAVTGSDDAPVMASTNYDRLTPVLDVLLGVPPERLVQYYHAWLPLLEQAYAELGKEAGFVEATQQALQRVQAVPLVMGAVPLARPSVMYTYRTPEMEAADDLSKLLWRMGPDNSQRIQAYAGQLIQLLAQPAD